MADKYICTLQAETDCKYLSKDRKNCLGNPACAFCYDNAENHGYVRQERWYEKYYRKNGVMIK